MLYLYITLGILGALVLWVVRDVAIALSKKPIPDLPETRHNSSELVMLHRVLTNPESLPESIRVDEKFIDAFMQPTLQYINNRYDCSDFSLLFLLRLYMECKDVLPQSNKDTIRNTFLNFKYWMDEPGEDSMCYWSENHQLIFAVCEYLAGLEWKEEIFTNSGMTGEEHRVKEIGRAHV